MKEVEQIKIYLNANNLSSWCAQKDKIYGRTLNYKHVQNHIFKVH